MDCQTPLSMGFPRQEYWSGLLFPSSGDLPDAGIEPGSGRSPALQADSLPSEQPGKCMILGKEKNLFPSTLLGSLRPTPVLLPGKSHGWRSLIGCSPWGR